MKGVAEVAQKKSPAKKAPAKKTAAKKASTKTATKKAPANKSAAKKAAPKKTAAKKTAAKKTAAKKTAAKKTAAKKTAAKKAPASKAAAKKAPAKKSAPKKTAAKKAPAGKAAAKKAPANKTAPKKAAPKSEVSKVDDARAAKAKVMAERRTLSAKTFKKPFLDKQRKLLESEREKYTRSAVSYKEEADSLVMDREPGDVQFDEESGEGDTLAVERERDLALSAQAQLAVEEIDAALQRLDDGVYGICVESGKPIPKERLEAIPWASQRVEYKVGGLGRR